MPRTTNKYLQGEIEKTCTVAEEMVFSAAWPTLRDSDKRKINRLLLTQMRVDRTRANVKRAFTIAFEHLF